MRLGKCLMVLSLIAACRSNEASRAEHAAKAANASAAELDHARDELAAKSVQPATGADRVARRAVQAAKADEEFELRKDLFVRSLRGRHDVMAREVPMLASLATVERVTDDARSAMRETLAVFQLRLDDVGHAIEDLAQVPAADWEHRADDVGRMMKRLDDARQQAWHAVTGPAPIIHAT
jgi:hypothetical protein